LILAYQGLEEENLDQKSPGLPGWGMMKQASFLLIRKRKLLRSPLEIQGRPKLTWAERIRGLMGEKGLTEEDLNDRSN